MIRKIIRYLHQARMADLKRRTEVLEAQLKIKRLKQQKHFVYLEKKMRQNQLRKEQHQMDIVRFQNFENRRKAYEFFRKNMLGF